MTQQEQEEGVELLAAAFLDPFVCFWSSMYWLFLVD